MTTSLAPTAGPPAPSPSPAADTGRHPAHRPVSFPGVLRSEWIKLRSLRSSTTTLAAAVGTLLFVGVVAAATSTGLVTAPDEGGGPGGSDPTGIALTGLMLVPLIIAVLGVMTATSEYATGTMRSTMTFVPRRLPVLWSKAAVLTAATLPVMAVASVATFLAAQALLASGDVATASLGDPGVLRAVAGSAVYLSGVALMGLAFGMLLRGTAVSISALFALLFLVPGLGSFLLPASVQDNVLLYLPTNAAGSFTSVAPGPELLGTGAGAAVFAAWVVVPLLVAAVAVKRRPV